MFSQTLHALSAGILHQPDSRASITKHRMQTTARARTIFQPLKSYRIFHMDRSIPLQQAATGLPS